MKNQRLQPIQREIEGKNQISSTFRCLSILINVCYFCRLVLSSRWSSREGICGALTEVGLFPCGGLLASAFCARRTHRDVRRFPSSSFGYSLVRVQQTVLQRKRPSAHLKKEWRKDNCFVEGCLVDAQWATDSSGRQQPLSDGQRRPTLPDKYIHSTCAIAERPFNANLPADYSS